MTKKIFLLSFICIAAIGFIAYANALKGRFIWDDEFIITDNSSIKSWSNFPNLFQEDLEAGSGHVTGYYRPLLMASYMFDFSCWRLNPVGYHLTNLLLHILVALSIYVFVQCLFGESLLSFLTSILFVAHPVHTEVVSYISGRSDALAFFFILLAFIGYLKLVSCPKIRTAIFVLMSYGAALLVRENCVIFPVLLIFYHSLFKEKINRKLFFAVLVLAVVYVLLRATVLRFLLAGTPLVQHPTTLGQRVPGIFAALAGYFRLLFFPSGLHMEYGQVLFPFRAPSVIAGIILAGILLVYLLRRGPKSKIVIFSLGWFFISILPYLNIFPVNAYMAEHWLYMPSLGFFLILAWGLKFFLQKDKWRLPGIILTAALLAFYSYSTIKQNDYWKDTITFYTRTLRYAPNSARILNNLAMEDAALGKDAEAIVLYQKAIAAQPRLYVIYYNLGNVYRAEKNFPRAMAAYEQAIEINPNFFEPYFALGLVYMRIQKHEQTIAQFQKARELKPNSFEVYNNLGVEYEAVGELGKAASMYAQALQLNPGNKGIMGNLNRVYATIQNSLRPGKK